MDDSLMDSKPDLLVIGAGISRSGTLSMRAALEQLLEGPCYHGVIPLIQQRKHASLWEEAINNGELSGSAHCQLLTGYKSGVDFPFNLFWEQLIELHPTAKVVLNVRDYKSHYKSLASIIHNIEDGQHWPNSWLNHLLGGPIDWVRMKGSWKCPSLGLTLYDAVLAGEEETIQFLKEWEEYVKAGVPEDRLLVFNVKEGWDPLCTFLNLPKPDCPFPKLNDTKSINMLFLVTKICSWLIFFALPIIMVLLAYFYSSSFSDFNTYLLLCLCVIFVPAVKSLCDNYMQTYARKTK